MLWRWAALAVAGLAFLASLAGLGGVSSLLLLAAIVAGAVRLIEVVGLAAESRADRLSVVTAAAGLVCVVAAGATHVTWLVAGLFAGTAFELIGRRELLVELPAEPAAELRRAA